MARLLLVVGSGAVTTFVGATGWFDQDASRAIVWIGIGLMILGLLASASVRAAIGAVLVWIGRRVQPNAVADTSVPQVYASVARELYEREKQHSDRWRGLAESLAAITREGPARVDAVGAAEDPSYRVTELSAPAPITGTGEIVVPAAEVRAEGHVEAAPVEAAPRETVVARADQLLDEGQFLLDRVRAGRDEYREHAEAWMGDVDVFLARVGDPHPADVSLDVLPYANDKFPDWVRHLTAAIDKRALLLRGLINRRYARIVVRPEPAQLRLTAYPPTVTVSDQQDEQ